MMKKLLATLTLFLITLPTASLALAGNPDLDEDIRELEEDIDDGIQEETPEETQEIDLTQGGNVNPQPPNTLLICPFAKDLDLQPYNSDTFESQAPNNRLIEKRLEEAAGNGTACGMENPDTGFIEKGDCTTEGKVITEVSEVFGPDITEDEDGNSIVSVYKGVCCLYTDDNGGSCVQTRNGYSATYEECVEGLSYCEKRQWIIGTSGTGILKIYVKQLYIWGAGIIGFISVATMVISGIQVSVSGASGDITAAKERIFKALGGLVLLFLSGLLLYSINPTFFS